MRSASVRGHNNGRPNRGFEGRNNSRFRQEERGEDPHQEDKQYFEYNAPQGGDDLFSRYVTHNRQDREHNQNMQNNENQLRVHARGRPGNSNQGMGPSTSQLGSNVSRQLKPKPQRRQSMSANMKVLYDQNPCISGLGVDCVSRSSDGTEIIQWSLAQGQVLQSQPNAARRQAIMPKPYLGKMPWRDWFSDAVEDFQCNGWSKEEAAPHLARCLRQGPGRFAVRQWKEKYLRKGYV